MSRIRPLRSSTRVFSVSSRLRSCPARSGWLTRINSAFVSFARAPISSTLPLPTKYLGSGRSRRAWISPTTSAPADSASARNSWISSSKDGRFRPTCNSRARSPLRGRSSNLPPWAREWHLVVLCLFLVHSRNAHVAGGDYGGDRVLVNHLADAIAQQNHELVERVDLPLQLDAIYEVDRDGHLLLA